MSEIVPTPPLDNTVATLQNVEAMIGEVAGLVGGSTTPQARSKAITCLDRAADRLNMEGVFLYRKLTISYPTSGSFSDGDRTLSFPSDWGWPTDPILAFDSDTQLLGRIEWKNWEEFNLQVIDPTQTGTPAYASIKNEKEGLIYLVPAIDASEVDTIVFSYFGRVQRPSEEDGDLLLTAETREALIAGGEFFIMRYRYAKFPRIWESFYDDFQRAMDGAIAANNRWIEATHPSAVPELEGVLSTRQLSSLTNARLFPGPAFIQIG